MTAGSHALLQQSVSITPVAEHDFGDCAAGRILVVDDVAELRDLYAEYLGERYSCVTAADAHEALRRLAAEPFAIVISDVSMPGLSGVELLRKIREHFQDVAVIIVSGIDRTQRVLDTMRLGASDYLLKPCDLGVLELSVERALERRALLRDARRYKHDLERRNAELAHQQAELKRLQAQIVHNEKMVSLGQLAAGVAHELNNPAGFIYGNMEVLRECAAGLERLLGFYDGAALPAAVADGAALLKREIDYENTLADLHTVIEDCTSGAERIRDVVQNLRTFSRLDEAEFKKVDIHEGIDSTIRLLSRFYASGHITLRRNYDALPPVDCFAGQLNQMWMNLLANAAQAVAGGGEVCVSTRLCGDAVLVSVSDTGPGIAAEHRDRIFEPFFTTKPVGEGTGLGLSITYGIVERHGGEISVESCPGVGTTFTVVLPVNAGARRGHSGGRDDL